MTILPLRHKCQRYNQEICNGSISCKSCSEALYDVKVSWRKPQTASQIQHYVLRWGTGFVFGDLPFISKEKKRTHVDPVCEIRLHVDHLLFAKCFIKLTI